MYVIYRSDNSLFLLNINVLLFFPLAKNWVYLSEFVEEAYDEDESPAFIDQHVLKSAKNKTVACKFCGKLFARKFTLKRHIKCHCKGFKRSLNLKTPV